MGLRRMFGRNQKQNVAPKVERRIKLDPWRRTALVDERTGKPYVDNTVKSSRHTIWNFLPRQLYFQLTKLANIYLLTCALLQFIPGLSPTSSYTGIVPIAVFIGISIGREGYDDFRRYKRDRAEGNKTSRRLVLGNSTVKEDGWHPRLWLSRRQAEPSPFGGGTAEASEKSSFTSQPTWRALKWKALKIGDIIKIERDEDVPADVVLLHVEGRNGMAYVETTALDGETNYKSKSACGPLSARCNDMESLSSCEAELVVESPNLDLYNFEGRVEIDGARYPLNLNEVLLRGCTLRNTSSAIGAIINTGNETKIRMNATRPGIKAPELQKLVNSAVIMLACFVISIVTACTVAYQFWTRHVERYASYLDGYHYSLPYTIMANILLLNTFIPVAMCKPNSLSGYLL